MKQYKFIIQIILFSFLLTSCKKYLDIPRNSGNNVVISSAEECQLLLDNYDAMNTGYPFDGNLASDDYYVMDADLGNIVQEDQEFYKWNGAFIRDVSIWTNNYQKIYRANLVLENAEKIKEKGGSTEATLNGLKGAALFFRAYTLWQIAQIYAKPFIASTAGVDPGIPIRLTSDVNDVSERGTVQQTYNRIIQDLEEAVPLLGNTSLKPTRPNKVAAYAMLARVYNSMEDYVKAGTNADAAMLLNSKLMRYDTLDQNSSTPFVRFNPEVIFHSVTALNNILFPDQYGGGPFNARIVPELVSAYQANDLRATIFLKDNGDGTFRFTGNYEESMDPYFFNGLAVDELYLIRSESYARAGNFGLAMADINTLLSKRFATGTYVNQTATTELAALTIILAERRKELLMRGLRWTDLRRLNKDPRFAKTLERKHDGTGSVFATLPANDLRYVYLLPTKVIQQGKLAQNPR